MHLDRNAAKLSPGKRGSRQDALPPWRAGNASDDDGNQEHGWGKAQRAFGARQQEALKQIREIHTRVHARGD